VAKARIFAGVTGEAAWDGEHGIGLYFENGARLVEVTAHPECL
jgi:hypothetical protein